MRSSLLPPLIALAIAAVVLIVAIVAFIAIRRRRPKHGEAVPLEDLPTDDAPVSHDDSFAPPVSEPEPAAPLSATEEAPPLATGADGELVFERVGEESFRPAVPQPSSTLGVPTTAERADVAKVSFRMFLPTQGHARSAAQIARRDGYSADVQAPANGEAMWLCVLTREMAASPAAIGEEMTFLAELAGSFGGRVER